MIVHTVLMNDSELDLRGMSAELKTVLEEYAELFSGYFSFERDFASLRLTPEKPYTARTEIPVYNNKKDSMATLYALAFKFHDGTGDDSTFKPGELELPGRFKPMENPGKVFPRSKQGIQVEAFFPFFTALGEEYHKHAVCLEELTVDDPESPQTIVTAGVLGLSPREYVYTLNRKKPVQPRHGSQSPPLFLTCGYQDEQRFGDPHAVYCSVPTVGVQVVGFLAVPDNAEADLETLGILFEAKGRLPFK